MAIGVIATITVRDGKNAEFEELFTGLTEQVLANEPGATFYALHRTKSDSQVYKVLEQYASKEALKAHGQTEYFLAASQKMGALVAAAPDIEVMDAV
ncbi:antibiotic biosynthesis monooxygenase [Porticoccaceae bacterium]|jgi:quinol monooxygenase YgiN|nr:antibiotic biosynthesis monooxygenase [Porticoccaceae bacterium]MBT6593685.1 antibiotic biosynthesis monooxygenase [Porticoccaceae bacterium]MDB4427524.1 antibiotic biosynthesis monooxygenase [Porticoccaceae bacterium]MDC0589134.1 antibiotic biosynthesis monooxygenase [Porticoccaceae bacterium]MDG1079302.1 putative quinol monooxygenase [Porticoccaceae bacterium]